MKQLLLILVLLTVQITSAQNSEFYGYATPTTAKLVPAPEENGPKKDIIVPNFKGRELVQNEVFNAHKPDWVWQQQQTANKSASATLLWQVQGIGNGISPPDPTGEADSTVYIQGTNANSGGSYKIFNKLTGASISGTLVMANLGSPNVTGLGDPVVLYYKSAKRWIITQFSSTSQKKLLVYVSQTSNPQGTYNFYQFTCPNFPDYPKWSICESSDALLATTNEGGPPRVYAMKLSALINGTTSPFIGTPIGYTLNGFGFQSITPVDLEGDLPAPSGQKPLFVRHRDDEKHTNGSPDSPTNDWIEIWEMTINWTNNTASVTKIQDVAIAEIDSDLCGLTNFSCIPQPGTTVQLDPLRECVMYKAPMRVFNDHQAMVLCLTTDVNGNNRAGVRWMELRRPSGSTGTWTLHQEGTYAPGTTLNRWMPSINIDKQGNIMMAYSTSGTTAPAYPSIQMTGRKACDPLGQMTVPETVIKQGLSARTANTRWGDYHHLCIDDFDGQTFYYTGVVMNANNAIVTNISAFKMNPDTLDLALIHAFPVQSSGICGSSTQVGVVLENQGLNPIVNGQFTYQVGSSNTQSINFTSSQLSTTGTLDTVYFNLQGLTAGSNNIVFTLSGVNGIGLDENTCNDAHLTSLFVNGSSSIVLGNVGINQLASCNANDGSVSINATGGLGTLSYSLNNGAQQASNLFTGLAAGFYNYQVSDSTGCSVLGSFQLQAGVVVSANIQQTVAISCAGDQNATLVVNPSGGTAPYAFTINNGADQPNNTFVNLGAGTYTIGVIDANGCTSTQTYVVTEPSAISVAMVPTMVSCNGANNGSLQSQVNGGTAPYSYYLNNVVQNGSGPYTNLAPGVYTLDVFDANGCQQAFTSTIVEPNALLLTATTTVSNGADGTIALNGSGGNSPYTFSINGTNYFSGSFFSNLAAGTYNCYVQDNHGCITTIEVVVNTSSVTELSFLLSEVYPNPNNGSFQITVGGVKGSKATAQIYNLQGQLISTFELKAVDGQIKQNLELSPKIAAGTYYLGIYDGTHGAVLQFVKQ